MARAHEHRHSHHDRIGRLTGALAITFLYMIAEAVGGWLTNSLALIADAGHMLTDVAALALTLGAIWFAARPATARKTFGWYRLEILAAFVNGVALVLLSIWVIYEAAIRWQAPPQVLGLQMTLVAAGGLIANLISARLLSHGHQHDLNLHGAWLHIMGDVLGAAAAIVAGVLIVTMGWLWADPITSVLISVIIIFGSIRLVLDSVNILLEGTPGHIDLGAITNSLLELEGVSGVHDLHVWTISSGREALSVHITHSEVTIHTELLSRVRDKLQSGFGIDHLTIQMETPERETEALYVCETGTQCFEPAKQH
ncbi:MAG: cation transporter [Acidobacteria bacterium]|nr:cation transporter [Acidobacteriota bacterium]